MIILTLDDEKVILNKTVKPCESSRDKKVEAMMRSMVDYDGQKNTKEVEPFTWRCPIQQVCS